MTPEEERIKRKIKNDLLREFKIVSGGKNLTHRETMDAITKPPKPPEDHAAIMQTITRPKKTKTRAIMDMIGEL